MDLVIKIVTGIILGFADKLKKWHDEKIARDNEMKLIQQQQQLQSIKETQAVELNITQAAAGMPQFNDVASIIAGFNKQPGLNTAPVRK